jgi:hypothetical protein
MTDTTQPQPPTDPATELRKAARRAPEVLPPALAELVQVELTERNPHGSYVQRLAAEVLALPADAVRLAPADQPDDERATLDVIDERDNAQEWADKLAYAIAPESVIGEHSSSNNPWANALDHAKRQAAWLSALRAEVTQLREYAETTRYHQQWHAEAVRELEKVRVERDRLLEDLERSREIGQQHVQRASKLREERNEARAALAQARDQAGTGSGGGEQFNAGLRRLLAGNSSFRQAFERRWGNQAETGDTQDSGQPVAMVSGDVEAFLALPECEACGGTGKARQEPGGEADTNAEDQHG